MTDALDLSPEERQLIVGALARVRQSRRVTDLMDKIVPGSVEAFAEGEKLIAPGDGFIYFIAAGDLERTGTLVKIGYSRHPGRRLAQLQETAVRKLDLVATIRGTQTVEASLHRRFHNARAHGEWFRCTPDLRGLIASVSKVAT